MSQFNLERDDEAQHVDEPRTGDQPGGAYDPEMTEEDEANAPDVEEEGDPGDREIAG